MFFTKFVWKSEYSIFFTFYQLFYNTNQLFFFYFHNAIWFLAMKNKNGFGRYIFAFSQNGYIILLPKGTFLSGQLGDYFWAKVSESIGWPLQSLTDKYQIDI